MRFSQILGLIYFPAIAFFLIFFKIEDKVPASGVVEARKQSVVSSPVKELTIREIRHYSGDRVEEGDAVVIFTDLREIGLRIEQLRLDLKTLRHHLGNLRELMEQGGLAKADFELKEVEVRQKETELRILESEREKLTVRAPFDGVITNVHRQVGEAADIGTPLFTIFADGEKIIRSQVQEKHFADVEIGQDVNIKSELYNYLLYQVYRGKVVDIRPYGEHEEGEVYYDVLIGFEESAEREMKVGSSATCEIILGERPLLFLLTPRR